MRDPLDDAVDGRIDAYRPTVVPALAVIEDRRRTRHRRRSIGAAALSVAVIASVAATAGGALPQTADRLPTLATTAAPAPAPSAPAGYTAERQEGSWLVASVGQDRKTVTIRVAGGGCQTYSDHEVEPAGDRLRLRVWADVRVPQDQTHGCRTVFTAEPVNVDLPRPLADGETLRGGCNDPSASADAAQCRSLSSFVAPTGGGLPSATITGLAVGDSIAVTLLTPCGVPPLLVDGVPYLPTGYAAPGTNPPGWRTTQQGRLRRTADDSLIFTADNSTVRLQFMAAPGRLIPSCD